jgi:hypothetical protein
VVVETVVLDARDGAPLKVENRLEALFEETCTKTKY